MTSLVSRTQSEKRRPTLADRFVRTDGSKIVERRVFERVQNRVRVARKFVLTDNAIQRVGEVIRDVPDLLFRESRLARSPYDVAFIEVPNFPLLYSLTAETPWKDGNTADGQFGFLIDHDEVYVIVGGTAEQPLLPPQLMTISYLLNTPWSDEDRQTFAKLGGVNLFEADAFCWGSTFNRLGGISPAELTDPNHVASSLRRAHSCRWLPIHPLFEPKHRRMFLYSAAGELRNIIAILLLLNRPRLTTYVEEVPAKRGFISGKLTQYFAHTVVTIDLDARPIVRKIGTPEGDAEPRRRHEVRGTWCRNYDAREYEKIGCVHEWRCDPAYVGIDNPDDPDHFVCGVCEGKLWWRNEFTRGDAEKGYVVKEYSVSAKTAEARAQRGRHVKCTS